MFLGPYLDCTSRYSVFCMVLTVGRCFVLFYDGFACCRLLCRSAVAGTAFCLRGRHVFRGVIILPAPSACFSAYSSRYYAICVWSSPSIVLLAYLSFSFYRPLAVSTIALPLRGLLLRRLWHFLCIRYVFVFAFFRLSATAVAFVALLGAEVLVVLPRLPTFRRFRLGKQVFFKSWS